MSYILPSILVYQQLANSGGVANISPDLNAVIMGPCYNIIDYDGSSASSLTLTAAGNIVDNTISNAYYLTNTQPGQVLDSASLAVYVNNASVRTLAAGFTGTAGSNQFDISAATSVATSASASAVLTAVANAALFVVGDSVTLPGAGVAAAALTATVMAVGTTTITLSVSATTVVTLGTLTKNVPIAVNPISSTYNVIPGDTAKLYYKITGNTKLYTTTVSSVVETGGIVTSFFTSDILPADAIAGVIRASFHRTFNNQLLAPANYDSTSTAATGLVTILPLPSVVYGTVVTGEVHIAYRALRTDLSGVIQSITTTGDILGTLGVVDDRNPLALGVELAMANSITQILAVAVPSDDLLGYETGLQLVEDARVYSIVPLTQSIDILTAVQQHVDQLSTPQMASWRIGLVSTAIPTVQAIGPYNISLVNANSGNNAITLVNGRFILTVSNGTFMNDGAIPGDIVHITSGTGTPTPIGSHQILQVISNQQLQIVAGGTGTAISYYVTRNLTKAQQAAYVAGMSTGYTDNRMINCPNQAGVVVNGLTKYLPGYYFMCGVAGLVAGLPSQAGLTNIALAGFVDVRFSNFYFTRAQMDVMASAGTFMLVQESQGSIPYVRHELTTDMSTYYYRELQAVKNWDYISYFFHDIMKSYIGKWNITPDTLNTLRQSMIAGGTMLQGRKLPKIGAPLTDFSIKTLAQDTVNVDNVICEMPIKMPNVLNNFSLYLIV